VDFDPVLPGVVDLDARLRHATPVRRSDMLVEPFSVGTPGGYPIGYDAGMGYWKELLREARRHARLTQEELARRTGTSRSTLSAYEHGRKAPSARTLERLLSAAGMRLSVEPTLSWREVPVGRGRACWVPDALWRLAPSAAFADVVMPIELDWSARGRRYSLRDRRQRARLYELLLREGTPADLERYVDGVLLIDLWLELVVPRAVRTAWQPVLDAALASGDVAAPAAPFGAAS
jgi:transcriptional regulator with XRE-family HTH domain